MRRVFVTLLIVAIGGLGLESLFACPFCGPAQSTLSEKLAKSDVIVIAKWLESTPQKKTSPGAARFTVVEQLGGAKKELKFAAGDEIKFPRDWLGKPGDRFVMFGFDVDELTWESPEPVSDATISYIREAPPFGKPARERLPFFLKHLESPDVLISMDAFAEFGCAPFDDVAALSPQFDRAKLRQIVASDKTSNARIGLYGMMLGLCGNDSDAKLLRERLDKPQQDEYLLGLDGLTFGYLMLTGSAGLDELDKSKLSEPNINVRHAYAAMAAMRVLWIEGKDRISRDRLKRTMRRLAEYPDLAELAIADLTRWEDWSIQDQLIERYGVGEFADRPIRRAIINYLLVAAKLPRKSDAKENEGVIQPAKGETLPASVTKARANLEKLRKKDPLLVKDAERFFAL